MCDRSKFSPNFKMDDVEGVIGLMSSKVLAAVLSGEIDLNEVASYEMANRGLNHYGGWIGFPAAAELHQERLKKMRS